MGQAGAENPGIDLTVVSTAGGDKRNSELQVGLARRGMAGLEFGLGPYPLCAGLSEVLVIFIGAAVLFLLKLIKNGLEVESGEATRVKGQATPKSVQDGISETERSERFCARNHKKKGPPGTGELGDEGETLNSEEEAELDEARRHEAKRDHPDERRKIDSWQSLWPLLKVRPKSFIANFM